jgi:hypothetical protein
MRVWTQDMLLYVHYISQLHHQNVVSILGLIFIQRKADLITHIIWYEKFVKKFGYSLAYPWIHMGPPMIWRLVRLLRAQHVPLPSSSFEAGRPSKSLVYVRFGKVLELSGSIFLRFSGSCFLIFVGQFSCFFCFCGSFFWFSRAVYFEKN